MNDDTKDKLCFEMFLDMIPENIGLPYPADLDPSLKSYGSLTESFVKSQVNGDLQFSSLFDKKSPFSNENLIVMSDLCTKMEVDQSPVEPVLNHDLKVIEQSSEEKSEDLPAQPTEAPTAETLSRDVKILCLENFDSLRDKCEMQGLIFNGYVIPDVAFEVDMIFEHKLIEGEMHYFVKWKNYSSESNTWEPKCHLTGCRETIEYYHAMNKSNTKINRKLLEYFVRDLTTRKPYDVLTLKKICTLCFDCSEKHLDTLQLKITQMRQKVKEIISFSYKRLNKISEKLFKIMQYHESRKRVLINLKEWEDEINSKNQTSYIEVENHVDLETAPPGFKFIHDYIKTNEIMIPEEPVAFCHCDDCYQNKTCCCPSNSDGYFAYSKYRRLLLQPGYPIYECNKRCKCSSDCINRLVQHGQKVKVSIFRTSNGCGWGLKTLETIEKGQFVLEYLGEIITSEAAEARGHIYDYIGRSYLFDLDYGVDNCSYTVDAGHAGNAAHFINHSCDPNLHVFAVWINQPDPNLPRLAFFAKRKIRRGEELTFDYKMVQKDRFGPENPLPENERILCRCKSRNCRKFLF